MIDSNTENMIMATNRIDKIVLNNNENIVSLNKITETSNKLNGVDSKPNYEIQKIPNMKGKQEDISIVDITNGGRIITDLEIKNAPVLLLEVK